MQTFSPRTVNGLFSFDSVEPNQEFIEQLIKVSTALNANPQALAVIVGHTDSTGSAIYNQALSERRAQMVVDRLTKLGITPIQIEWRGEGESHSVADNETEEGRAKNRRVEITITIPNPHNQE